MSAYEIYAPEDDDAAFAAVYRAHSEKLLRYCQYRLRDRHEAEDVVQEAFARAWRTMPVTGPDGNFYPWLRVVAGNLCTDILRKRSRSQPVAVVELGAVDGGMDEITEESDRVLVRQALGRLNDRHRSALMMREDEGLTYDQIAQRTGVTSGTVESLLWRARQALKREFTVLAGREGCLAVLPFVALFAARVRAAGRAAWVRIGRRLAAVPGGDHPVVHAALAAAATITVVSGLAVTLRSSGSPSHGPVVLQGPVQAVSTTLPDHVSAAPPPVAATSAAGVPTPATSVTTAAPTQGAVTPAVTTFTTAAVSGRAPLRVANPVAVGPSAATYAQQSPVAVGAGGLTLGVSPQAVSDYAQGVAQRVTPTVSSAVNALKENPS